MSLWEKAKHVLTPGTWKVFGITFLLDLLSFSGTVYQYLGLVNLYNLIEDPTTYVKIVSVVSTLIGIPTSLLNDKLYKVSPARLMPVLYLTKGFSLLFYGVIMYQETWDPYLKLGLSFLVTVPLHFAAHFDGSYFERHLFVELSQRYGVKLGVTNSGRSILGSFTHGLQVIIVGQIYQALTLEQCSLYLCSFCFFLSLTMTALSIKLFKDYPAIPQRKQRPSTLYGNLKTQFLSLKDCKIYKILVANILDSITISHAYVALFFLESGLDELSLSYIQGVSRIFHISCAVLNVIKYKFAWGKKFAEMFIVGHCVALFLLTYTSVCWGFETLTKNKDTAIAISMPNWMIVYYILSLTLGVVTGTVTLAKQEFLQENIPTEDRGSIAGVGKILTLLLHMLLAGINLLLSDDGLYTFNFILSIIIHAMTLAIMVSYWQDEKKENEKTFEHERVPLTSMSSDF